MWLVSPSLYTAKEWGSQWAVATKELKPGDEGGGSTLVCMEAGDVGGRRLQKYSSKLQLLLLKIDPGKFWLWPVS